MIILLDTHVFLWLASDPERIAPERLAALRNPGNEVIFSVVNLWELTIKFGGGRGGLPFAVGDARDAFLQQGYGELDVTAEHVLALSDLPPIHRDPFDRMLAAQAKAEGAALATADRSLARYPVPIFAI